MESQLSYSQIEVNGKYKIDNREIIVIDKHIAIISSATDPEFSGHEERIVYYFVDDEYTNRSSPFKNLTITY
jgi:flagellar biosynthesis regulator FlaF